MYNTNKIIAFEKNLIFEMLISLLFLIISREIPQLLVPYTYFSFFLLLFIQIKYIFKPDLAVLNLCFIVSSGVFSFFCSKIGLNLNFILYPIVLVSLFLQLKVKRIHFLILSLIIIYYSLLILRSYFSSYSKFVSVGDGSTVFSYLFCLLIYSFILLNNQSQGLNSLFIKVIFFSFLILSFDFISAIVYGPFETELINFEDKRLSIKISGVGIQGNQLGVWLAIFIPLINSQLLSKMKVIISGFLFILFLFLIILIGTRGGIILYLIALFSIFRKKINIFYFTLLLLFIGLVFYQFIPIIESNNLALYWKLLNTGEEGTGDDSRISKYSEVLKVFIQNPVFGIGFNNFTSFSSSIGFDGLNTHNTILSVIVEQGIVGSIFFFLLFCMPLFLIRNNRRFFMRHELESIFLSFFLVFLAFFLDHLQGLIYYYIWIGYITTFVLNKRKVLK
jgi:O-antigen ligase